MKKEYSRDYLNLISGVLGNGISFLWLDFSASQPFRKKERRRKEDEEEKVGKELGEKGHYQVLDSSHLVAGTAESSVSYLLFFLLLLRTFHTTRLACVPFMP